MNIIETMKQLLQSFPEISKLNLEFTEPSPGSFCFSSMGDSLVSEDVLGNQTRQHTFMLYSVFSAINDYERLANSGVLLSLAQWLDEKSGIPVTNNASDGDRRSGEITRIRCDNGMLYALSEDQPEAVTYQLQIKAEYSVII